MKVKVKIPTDLSDIRLSQYQKFLRTTKGKEDDNYIARQMVGIFCNLPDDVVGLIKAKDYDGIINDIKKVLEQQPKFIERFKLNGIEYGFIPKLDDITVEEKVDIDTFYQDVQKMDKAMAVLYRPIVSEKKGKYEIEAYTEVHKSIDPTLDVVFGANVFFSTLINDLLNCTQNFMEHQMETNINLKEILEKNGIGINQFTHSLTETFSNLRQYIN